MMENKKLNMVISLLIAIGLWAFVIGEVNPEATMTYRDIPIKFQNQQVLENKGLAVYSISDTHLNVTLTGKRSEISQIENKDIVATVDFTHAVIGENSLRIDVKVPSKVDIDSQSIGKITVVVEEYIVKQVPVEVYYEGDFEQDEEPITVKQSVEDVNVSGAASAVKEVVAARANVGVDAVTEEENTLECDLTAVDSSGESVSDVDLSRGTVEITSKLAKLKTVSLRVPVEGEFGDGVYRTIAAPKEIVIKGKSADLKKIEEITSETMNLDGIKKNTTLPINPILPEGVELSDDNGKLEAVVTVTAMESKELKFDQDDIKYINVPEGMEISSEKASFKVEVSASKTVLASVDKKSITLTADLSGWDQEAQLVTLTVDCSVEGVSVKIRPSTVTVSLKSIDDPPPADGSDQDNINHESEE